jgi:hypothetical protein
MKKLVLFVLALVMGFISFSQQRNIPPTYDDQAYQPMENGFKKENLFLGGNIALGIGNSAFNIGATPEIGYSLNKWLDAGLAINLNYFSQSYTLQTTTPPYSYIDVKDKSFNYGAGIFGRAWVLPYLFAQVQPEINWIKTSSSYYSNQTTSSASLLVGIGYGSRLIGSHYTYFTLMFDILGDKNSPYVDYSGAAFPVVRAGFGFYLHPNRRR